MTMPSVPDSSGAFITAYTSPVGSGGYVEYDQLISGTMDIDLGGTTGATPGLIRLVLFANNTGINFVNYPPNGVPRIFVLSVEQYPGIGGKTWASSTANVLWAGGSAGTTATADTARDVYTIMWTGKNFCIELARAMNVHP